MYGCNRKKDESWFTSVEVIKNTWVGFYSVSISHKHSEYELKLGGVGMIESWLRAVETSQCYPCCMALDIHYKIHDFYNNNYLRLPCVFMCYLNIVGHCISLSNTVCEEL